MEGRLALVRATHLGDYISVLRDIGAPVDRDLDRSALPPDIEATPDFYVSVPVAIEWIARTGRDLEPMALGLLGAGKASLTSLRPAQRAAILTAQTGLRRLETLTTLSRFEDSALEMHIRHEGDNVRIVCNMVGLQRHPFVCLAEWLNLQGVISVVRSVAGDAWNPSELCFVSITRPPDAVVAAFPDTRILVGQPETSVVVARMDLARPSASSAASARDPASLLASAEAAGDSSEVWEFVSLLRLLVQPYLSAGRPDIAFVAGLAGISTRTLQRRLKLCGSSYSTILQEASFALACRLLADPATKVIDVAMTVGYNNPQHFTRAFRRFAGVTPSEYRHYDFRHQGTA